MSPVTPSGIRTLNAMSTSDRILRNVKRIWCQRLSPLAFLGRSRLLVVPCASLLMTLSLCAQDTTTSALPQSGTNFFSRLGAAYRADWHPDPNAPTAEAPARRGLPSPLASPPFPSADWSYGGSPVIGEPDTNTYPVMTAVNGATSRTKLYGWFEPSVNGSTSRVSNSPELNDVYSNRLELSQFVIYVERLPDTVQRDHVDWGFPSHLPGGYRLPFHNRKGATFPASTSIIKISMALIRHWNIWISICRMLPKE